MSTTDMWTYTDQSWSTMNLVGYSVEADDGSIGKIDEASNEVGSAYLVVDTGPWIFGKKVMLPAGTIVRVDNEEQRIFVNRTQDQIKGAPEFSEEMYRRPEYRQQLGEYYGMGGAGYRD
jgi:hypothetical protein